VDWFASFVNIVRAGFRTTASSPASGIALLQSSRIDIKVPPSQGGGNAMRLNSFGTVRKPVLVLHCIARGGVRAQYRQNEGVPAAEAPGWRIISARWTQPRWRCRRRSASSSFSPHAGSCGSGNRPCPLTRRAQREYWTVFRGRAARIRAALFRN